VADEEEQKPNKINTPCKFCIFAKFSGKTQTGCKMNRIEPFTKLGHVLEATDPDDGKEFFIIDGRFCNAYQEAGGQFAKTFKPEDWAKTMRQMLRLRLAVLVVMENGVSLQSLEPTIESLKKQTLLPHQVVFINNQSTIKPSEFHAKLFKQIGNDLTWRINQICERLKDGNFVTTERAIDLAMATVTGTYYTVIRPGFVLPPSFVNDLDVAMNDNMERFSLLLPDAAGNCLTVQTEMHKHPQINGNAKQTYEQEDGTPLTLTSVVEKLVRYAEIEKRQDMVRTASEICPSLKSQASTSSSRATTTNDG